MAAKRRCTLKQGDCKNAFCQGILPPDKITIVEPPIGDPDAKDGEYWLLKWTLYGLRRSPKHWYNKIQKIFYKLGLQQNAYDPCLFSGNILDPSDPLNSPSTSPLTLGIYVDDFVYFSEDPEVEAKFLCLLQEEVTADFMGSVEWFLGRHFQWMVTPDLIQVHLSQTGFASHLVKENNITFITLLRMLRLIGPVYQSMPVQSLTKMRSPRRSSIARRNTRALLIQLAGLLKPHALTLLHPMCSCRRISTNHLEAISTLFSTFFITSIQPLITVSPSLPRRKLHSTHT